MRGRGRAKIRASPHMQALSTLHRSGCLPARRCRGDTGDGDGDGDPPQAGKKPPRRRERWAQEETMPAEKNPPWAICSDNLNPRTTLNAGSFLSVQSIQSLVL